MHKRALARLFYVCAEQSYSSTSSTIRKKTPVHKSNLENAALVAARTRTQQPRGWSQTATPETSNLLRLALCAGPRL